MPRVGVPGNPPTDTTAEPPAVPERSMVEWALYWAENGWPVFPLKPSTKIPLFPSPHPKARPGEKTTKCDGRCGQVGHGVLDATRDPDKIRKWWGANPSAGIGGSTLGRVVLDFDYDHGAVRQGTLPPSREHLSGRGGGNCHLIYRAGGPVAQAILSNQLAKGIDIRAGSGSYVVLPPSIHPDTGKTYTVANDTDEYVLQDADIDLIWGAYGANQPASVKAAKKGLTAVPTGSGSGIGAGMKLSELLAAPPARGDGQTNIWLTKVAGHYAKMHRDKRDLYEVEVRRAAAMVDPGYEDTEKVLESVWATEVNGHSERDAKMEGGFIVGTGTGLLVQVSKSDGDGGREYTLEPWANFDLRAHGVMIDHDNQRSYQVAITAQNRTTETTLSPDTLADTKKMTIWLARYGAVIYGNEQAFPRLGATTRLQMYLESQRPAEVRVVDNLGWDANSEQYITLAGAITRSDVRDIREAGVIANRDRVNHKTAKYHYGFTGSWEEAQEVLREVQTFHFEDVVHLHGAWWAGTLLKPQAMTVTSLYPFFAAEAGSGSAKTTGYFALMCALNGNYHGPLVATTASFRDSAAVHTNGILWADDMDNPERLQEIIRTATAGGSLRKMGEDRVMADFTLLNPMLFTGEALQMSSQKALLERGVLIHPKSPTERKSVKPGREGLTQWRDITDLQDRYRGEYGLAVLAGWYVQKALGVQAEFLAALKARQELTPGRRGEKYAVLTAGARLMDYLLGEEGAWDGRGVTARWVDKWAAEQVSETMGVENDSNITIKLLPWAVQNWGPIPLSNPRLVDYRGSKEQAPPVLVVESDPQDLTSEPEVWVNTTLLAKAWEEAHGGRVDQRLETAEGLQMQIQQVAWTAKGGQYRINRRIGGHQTAYRRLLPGYAKLVLDRASGLTD